MTPASAQAIAVSMVTRARVDDPADCDAYLSELSIELLREVIIRLAEMVPESRSVQQLFACMHRPKTPHVFKPLPPFETIVPCGTDAGRQRHRDAGDTYCAVCGPLAAPYPGRAA